MNGKFFRDSMVYTDFMILYAPWNKDLLFKIRDTIWSRSQIFMSTQIHELKMML
jgi:hypothetical protein